MITFPAHQYHKTPHTHKRPCLTRAFELARPHALPRGGALWAVGGLATSLGAVAGSEDLALVDLAVVLRRAAHRAAHTRALGAVGAPLTLQGRLRGEIEVQREAQY